MSELPSTSLSIPSSKELKKYQKALSKVAGIISNVDALNDLKTEYLSFKRTKQSQFKESFKIYRNHLSNVNKVDIFESKYKINHRTTNRHRQVSECNQKSNDDYLKSKDGFQHNSENSRSSIPQDSNDNSLKVQDNRLRHSENHTTSIPQDVCNLENRRPSIPQDVCPPPFPQDYCRPVSQDQESFAHHIVYDDVDEHILPPNNSRTSTQNNNIHLHHPNSNPPNPNIDRQEVVHDRRSEVDNDTNLFDDDISSSNSNQNSHLSSTNSRETNEHTETNTNDDNLQNNDEVNIDDVEPFFTCCNCHRTQNRQLLDTFGDSYEIFFHHCNNLQVRSRRKFKHIHSTSNEDNSIDIILCSECHNHLIDQDDSNNANKSIYTWPSFIWYLFSDPSLQHLYGDFLWKFIPTQWRYWWIDEVQLHIPSLLNVTIDNPSPTMEDCTHIINEWNNDVDSFLLSRLAKTCDNHLMPNILCPWGCTEYYHK